MPNDDGLKAFVLMLRGERPRRVLNYERRIATLCAQHGIQSRYYNGNTRPFCWNVKLHTDPSFEQVFSTMGKYFFECEADAVVSTPNLAKLKEDWTTEYSQHYDQALQDMCDFYADRNKGGGYTLNFIRPRLEHKYHVKPPEGRGWDYEFNFYGRSNGWLSLERFEGIELRTVITSPDHLYMDLEDTDDQLYRRKLCAYLEEISLMVKKAALEEELRYQLAFHMNNMVEKQHN